MSVDERRHEAIRSRLILGLALAVAVVAAGITLAAVGRHVPVFEWRPAPPTAARIERPSQPSAPVVVTGRPPAACGQPGEPDCPLQAWMDDRMNTLYTTRATKELAEAFRVLVRWAPDGYPDWVGWSEGGAVAAEKGDLRLAKRACSGCHDDYRERYRAELRSRSLP